MWLGTNDVDWVWTCVDKAISTSLSGEFFRHRRNGFKALHVILRSNPNGKYLEVLEFHSGSRQGVLRIPEGEMKKSWSVFSNLCKGFWDNNPLRGQATSKEPLRGPKQPNKSPKSKMDPQKCGSPNPHH